MSLTLTVILISRGLLGGCFLDSLRDRLLGKIEGDLTVVKGSFLTALITAWKAEILVDAAFEFKRLVKGNDLNPVEEHESGWSLRKSLSFLGLAMVKAMVSRERKRLWRLRKFRTKNGWP
jgi:hypothetical protein